MLTALVILFSIVYATTFATLIYGWVRLVDFKPSGKMSQDLTLTVVVACRNEAMKLPQLLDALANQTCSNFDIVLVNDHSSDTTLEIMNNAIGRFNHLSVINSDKPGKKQALRAGIRVSKSELILTTDADCMPCPTWVETFLHYFQQHPSDMIIGPVSIQPQKSLFSQLQSLEFASMVASGGGAASIHRPILCNGANLGFLKSVWLRCQSELRMDILSGDDMFLLQSIKRRGGSIRFLKSPKAMVESTATDTIQDFINQRIRWASKSAAYTDEQIIVVSLIVMSVCIMLVGLGITSLFYRPAIYQWSVLFITKLLIDGFFVTRFTSFFNIKNPVINTLVLSMIYPFYVTYIGLHGLFAKQIVWK